MQNVVSLLKLYCSVLTAEALSFVNMDEREYGHIYDAWVYPCERLYPRQTDNEPECVSEAKQMMQDSTVCRTETN